MLYSVLINLVILVLLCFVSNVFRDLVWFLVEPYI
jgi:hypothetical protein